METNSNPAITGPVDIAVTDSNTIRRIQADPELKVTFKNGSTYQYESVPERTIGAFLGSDSKGQFLRAQIIPFFVAKKLLLEEKKENVND